MPILIFSCISISISILFAFNSLCGSGVKNSTVFHLFGSAVGRNLNATVLVSECKQSEVNTAHVVHKQVEGYPNSNTNQFRR